MTQHSFNYSQRFHTYMTDCYCSDISWSYCLSTIFFMYFFFLYKNCNCVRTLAAGLCYIRVLIHSNAVFVIRGTCSTVYPGFCSLLLCHMYYVASCVAYPCCFALPFFLAYCLPDRTHLYMSAYFLVWILYFQAHHAILFLATCNLCCYLACMYMYCSCFWCALPLFINMLLLLVSLLFFNWLSFQLYNFTSCAFRFLFRIRLFSLFSCDWIFPACQAAYLWNVLNFWSSLVRDSAFHFLHFLLNLLVHRSHYLELNSECSKYILLFLYYRVESHTFYFLNQSLVLNLSLSMLINLPSNYWCESRQAAANECMRFSGPKYPSRPADITRPAIQARWRLEWVDQDLADENLHFRFSHAHERFTGCTFFLLLLVTPVLWSQQITGGHAEVRRRSRGGHAEVTRRSWTPCTSGPLEIIIVQFFRRSLSRGSTTPVQEEHSLSSMTVHQRMSAERL